MKIYPVKYNQYKMSKLSEIQVFPQASARRSQRRKNKFMPKYESQYKIPNPYRSVHSCKEIPSSLFEELSKFQELSLKSLKKISFRSEEEVSRRKRGRISSESLKKNLEMNVEKSLLNKMRQAASRQESEYQKLSNFLSSSFLQRQSNGSPSSPQEIDQQKSEQIQSNQCQKSEFLEDSFGLQMPFFAKNFSYPEYPNIFNENSHENDHRYFFYSDQPSNEQAFYQGLIKDDMDPFLI